MSSENSTLVKLNNAGFKQNDKWLVEGVSLTVEKGKIVTLIGPNGSGKELVARQIHSNSLKQCTFFPPYIAIVNSS